MERDPFLGQVVYLRGNSNISTGGDSLDFTEEIPESYQKLAIESAKAAGATFCGVDMMIDDIASFMESDGKMSTMAHKKHVRQPVPYDWLLFSG
ncbi:MULTISPECIES: glutamate/cysteine ligase /amino acid ligase [Paenibacillus]|uniref:Uncharacterized protein n=1 Tax=Paenibacillus alvei TaxID=44250 RepID=A0ABT4E8R2_PAEAL|nr:MULTISPECIES: glutamate/cysteine ligase /amino acid ligase [Paenibacillus]EPY13680.1 glutamate/cysteine ligase, /amino acid ligase [Paenibacillus alvei A6-6i-x]MCY9530137.1 hypothetical protein [Paenibacillus alvei]SDF63349.1 hypothetical protein SAMN04488689_10626 [Paenibacillus sp. cl6col]